MDMKKVGIIMTLLMGVTLSFCLSLTGNLTSEDGFKLIPFLVSFAVSTVISILIGFVVPMRKIESGAVKAMGLKERSLPANIISSLISDLIYTPVITLSMIVLARRMAMKMSNGHAQLPPFAIMFLKSLIISFVVAFLIILIVTPIYIKLSMKLAGVNPSAGGPPADKS
ncbi:MAG: hypothetical protein J5723_02685 [Ruminococcus sp.]|nr:hypothetical protein [Ruminococcus sp.]